MDTQQSRYVEKYQNKVIRGEDADEDELFLELENELEQDQFMSSYREQRLEQLLKEYKRIDASDVKIDAKFGNVRTVTDEKQVIDETVNNKYTIIHFYKQDFKTCQVMDNKLAQLSTRHLAVRFLRCDVIKSPFLVTKLNIKMLPCVVIYINGVERDRIVGFEKLGSANGIDFQLEALESYLYQIGVINRISRPGRANVGEPSDDELDL